MNERIRRLAEQAGDDWDHTVEPDKEFLKKFAELIAAEEREACAKLCEESNDIGSSYGLAQAIRARGNDAVDIK